MIHHLNIHRLGIYGAGHENGSHGNCIQNSHTFLPNSSSTFNSTHADRRSVAPRNMHRQVQQDLQPEPALLWWRARISLTSFNGKFRIAEDKTPSVLNEKAAAQRVKGRSHAVAFRNSFCSVLFMNGFLLVGP
jgi:hypothetical protein